jgi:hypothetical protein
LTSPADEFLSEDTSGAEDDEANYTLPTLVDDNSEGMELKQEQKDASSTPSTDK